MAESELARQMQNLRETQGTGRKAQHASHAEIARKNIESILSLMPAAVYTCDEAGRITFFNQNAAEIWGRKPRLNCDEEKFCGSFHIVSADGSLVPLNECPMALAVTTGKSFRNEEVMIERPDGSRRTVRVSIDPLYDDHGRRCGAINAFQDVTDLKQGEQASRRLAALVESSEDAIATKDLNGMVTSWNRAAERLFGYAAEEMIGKPITLIIPPEHKGEEAEILERVVRGERIEHYETVRRRRDGSLVDLSLTVSPIKDARGVIIGASKIARDISRQKQAEKTLSETRDALASANAELEQRVMERTAALERANAALLRDIEEQRKLEAQLRQAQKMESVGTLAGGIAHDLNNVLNIIKSYAAVVLRHPSVSGEVAEQLSVIGEATDRGTSVVRQLLTLARKTESRLTSTHLNEVISGLANLLKQTLPKTIDISVQTRVKLPPVMADSNQITQALLNLCVNARDVMRNGGQLTLRTRTVDTGAVKDPAAQAGPYVCIEVEDTGEGMTESIRNRIFEPFFTTKEIGEGTGLGLAIVYGIVKNHSGFIEVESEPGRGTVFRIYLPAASAPQGAVAHDLSRKMSVRGEQGKTVLLVEDEEMMVRLLHQTLSRRGYTVLVALDGEQALDQFQLHKHEIDTVLLDIGLPKRGGWDVILRMKQEKPDINVVVSSGYVDPEFRSRMHQVGVREFIDKPYTPDAVVEAIDAVVEASDPGHLDSGG